MDQVLRQRLNSQKVLPFKARLLGVIAVIVVRLIGCTMRWKLDDPDDVINREPGQGLIWVFWHNRIFAIPLIYKVLMPRVRGVVLTSPSRDGDYLGGIARALSVCSERGSSSKKGGRALVALTEWIKEGFVVGITPDGPRGPRYRLAPGPIKLSQITQAPIVTMHIDYSKYWALHKSWDHFRIPKPFSTLELNLTLNDPIPPRLDDEAFEKARTKIEHLLNPKHETD